MQKSSFWLMYRIAACDFKLTWKERSVIIWIFLMPLAFMLFFGMSFGRSGGYSPKAKLTIENQDDGFVSLELIEALRQEQIEVVDSLPEGDSAVRTLVIPPDFTEKVLSRERVAVLLSKEEGANISASEAVSVAIFRGLLRVVSGLVELEAEALERGFGGIERQGDSISGSLWNLVSLRPGAMDSLHVELDRLQSRESLVAVNSSYAGKSRKIPSGFQSSVPGSLVMFVLMAMVFSGTGITAERASGVLQRLGMTPVSKGEIVLGKILGRMAIAGIQILFLLIVGKFVFRISLGNDPIALIVLMIAFAFCTGSFAILFGSLFKNPDQVAGFAIITTLVMAALGGCWWPLEVVPRTFQIVAFFLPTGWTINGLHKLVSFGYGLPEVIPHISVLVLFGIAFIFIGSKKLKWSV